MNPNPKSLTSLSELVETHTFNRGGGSIDLDIDLDAFTEDYFRRVGRRQKERYKQRILKGLAEEQAQEQAKLEAAQQKEATEESEAVKDTVPVVLPDGAEIAVPQLTLENIDEAMASTDRIWERSALFVEDQKVLRVDMLLDGEEPHPGSVLRAWDAELDDNQPAPLNSVTLMRLSHRAIEELWEFCAEKARTVKKKKDQDATEEDSEPASGKQGTFSKSAAG